MNHHSLKKICSIAAILALILVATPLAVTAQWAYPPGEWKFRIVDDWGEPVSGAVAYLYNSTKPVSWNEKVSGPWTFEKWPLVKWGEADADGWVTIPELPGDAWDLAAPGSTITYTLVIKLKIGTTVTPITIFNYTVLSIGDNWPSYGTPTAIGLYTLLNTTTVRAGLGLSPQYPGKPWITGKPVDSTKKVGEKLYGVYMVWLYYVAMQLQDVAGFPITGAELRVFYTSSYNGKTYIQNTPVSGWVNKEYGRWTTNGTLGSELIPDTQRDGDNTIYDPDLSVGWVVLRVPKISPTTGADSSLVNNMTFVWLFKTNTTVAKITYSTFTLPTAKKWVVNPSPTTVLVGNATHIITAQVKWTGIRLLDCRNNSWWTMRAEVYAFDTAYKNMFQLAAARVAPGIFLLRYPVPVVGNTTITLAVEWYYSTVAIRKYFVNGTIDELAGSIQAPKTVSCNVTWVDVRFWSASELPQQPADFAAKIWLPATIGFRKAEPLTVWWNGRNGFVVLPDMEYYAGPNPSTMDQLDPYNVARPLNFTSFYTAMIQPGTAGGFGGNGWLPTRQVGWVDFEVYYEGVEVLDTYEEGESLKLTCCESTPPSYTACHFNLTLKIYEIGFHIILEACNVEKDAPTGVPFFFKHPNPVFTELIGPKAVTDGKVDIVKAPAGNYSGFAIVWHMSLLRPYKILYLLDNGTTIELTEPITLTKNMRNIQLYFKLWNLTIDTWSSDPFRLVNVNVTLFSVSDFGIAPGMGISKRQLDIITDPGEDGAPPNIAYQYVLPPGWSEYARGTDEYGYPVIYYHTDTQTNYWNKHPSWNYLPEKDYWIWVNVPSDAQKAMNSGFRAVDANATLFWSGDPWNKPLHLNTCYGKDNPYVVNTYVYNPKIALKTACGEPLVFDETMNSALILAEPWDTGNLLYFMQQIDPNALVTIGTPSGVTSAPYNAYLVRKNATDADGIVTLSSVNATKVSPPNDEDLWNPTTGWVAKYYPNQSRYLIGRSTGTWQIQEVPSPIKVDVKGSPLPKYRLMVYYKGVLVYNETTVLTNPYANKDKLHTLTTSVYPYVFRATNDPLPDGEVFGIPNINVTVFWAGLNLTWWPTKHLTYETAPIEFSLLNASKLEKSFNMSVVKRLWGPKQVISRYLENIPYQPVPPYFSSMVVTEWKLTDSDGKASFLIPVWNYSVTSKIYTWTWYDFYLTNLYPYYDGPRNPWNKALGPLSINLKTAGATGRIGALFGTPVYANFTTVPGVTNNVPIDDVPRMVGVLDISVYGRWWQHSMNATGLVNPATKTWEKTRVEYWLREDKMVYLDGVSLNTTYRTAYKKEWWAGVGMLGGGAYQHRAPDLEDGKTYSPPQPTANCYAKAEERVVANDIAVVVRNLVKVGLPNQKVTITREAIYIYVKDDVKSPKPFSGADVVKIASRATLKEDWTPTIPNADPTDYYMLYLRSTRNNILWGVYDFSVRTENLTRGMSNTLLKLNDPQFLVKWLEGDEVDWVSQKVYLDWPARLSVTILTEDGRPLEKAWVYVIDAYTRGNVTAAITDKYGHAGTLFVGTGNAAEHLKIEPGDRVDIGFNLLRGWYWLDEHKRLTGRAVNEEWDMNVQYPGSWPEDPPQPVGAEYIQCGYYWWDEYGSSENGYEEYECMRFYGKYYIVVYYKPAGCSEVQGPVFSEVVFDSYTDEPQHQYIYLGIHPEALAPVAEYDPSQAKTFRAAVRDLRMSFTDAAGRPLTGVSVKAKHPVYGWESELAKAISVETNTATLSKVPLKPGTSYSVQVEWTSKYGTKATGTASITETETSISLPIYDVTLRLLTPRGAPIVGVPVKVAGVDVGATSATGEVMVPQIPPGSYSVAASWLETALSLPSLVVSAPGAVTLTPTNLHVLTVRVIGAQGQALEGATVRVTKGAVEVTRLTDKDGKAQIELPDASYNIEVTYGQFSKTDSVTMTADTLKTFNLDVFIEFLGVGMSMAQFLLFIVMVIIIVIVLAIVIHEYHIYRRKRLPQLFGAPTGPK